MRLAGQSAEEQTVVRLAPDCDPAALSLTPAEGFLLSRIDGRTSRGVLRRIGSLAPAEIDRCLERWLEEGVLELVRPSALAGAGAAPPKPPARTAPPQPPPAASAASGAAVRPAIDPSLEIDVEVQRELLDFAGRLERPYHEILGVERNADERTLKKAYFALSKRLHPDRYFRRRIGAFAPLVETCFKKLLEAYELLSDPKTRNEVQARPTPARDVAPARRSSLEARRRLRERVGVLAGARRAADERKRKAKTFFEAGMAAFAKERWLEAAGAVRLAIAFDLENAAFRERFAEVQRRAHEERAKALQKQAESALELRDFVEALRMYEEAVHYRPADPELAMRGAKIAQALGELKKAKELASHAVELAPENGAYRRTLGLVYRDAGLAANARRELEAALRRDPNDGEAKAALRGL